MSGVAGVVNVSVSGGDSGVGGDVSLSAGSTSDAADGGLVIVQGGQGASGGMLALTSGVGTESSGGTIVLSVGDGFSGTGGLSEHHWWDDCGPRCRRVCELDWRRRRYRRIDCAKWRRGLDKCGRQRNV